MYAIMLANLSLLPFRHAFVTAHSSIWPVCVDGPDASKASGDGLQYVCERIRARGGLAIRNWSESHVMESRQSCNRKKSTKVMTQKSVVLIPSLIHSLTTVMVGTVATSSSLSPSLPFFLCARSLLFFLLFPSVSLSESLCFYVSLGRVPVCMFLFLRLSLSLCTALASPLSVLVSTSQS